MLQSNRKTTENKCETQIDPATTWWVVKCVCIHANTGVFLNQQVWQVFIWVEGFVKMFLFSNKTNSWLTLQISNYLFTPVVDVSFSGVSEDSKSSRSSLPMNTEFQGLCLAPATKGFERQRHSRFVNYSPSPSSVYMCVSGGVPLKWGCGQAHCWHNSILIE